MSKLDLIRAGHTEVADGQCGLCDVPWPCAVGVVLDALTYETVRAAFAVDRAREAESKLAAAEARAEAAERDGQRLLTLNAAVAGENARLRERLATVEAVLSRYGEESNWFRTFHPQDDGWLQPVWAWDTMEDPKQIARAALAATPAAVPDEDVAMILPPVMTFGKRQSLPDFDRREQRQHGGEG